MDNYSWFAKKIKVVGGLLFKSTLLGSLVLGALSLDPGVQSVLAQEDEEGSSFSNFEIRVIRPRYFSKRKRFELGVEGMVNTNQTFIYTYLLSGLLTFHLTESLGLELSAAYGVSADKDDKVVLEDDFNIKTQIIRTKTIFEGNGLWTPIYGKYQLASGRLVYFDTYLSAGVGMTGVEYKYSHCVEDGENTNTDIPVDQVVQYGTFSVGIGQRFFISKNSSVKWDLRDHFFSVNSKDGACQPVAVEEAFESIHQNITMQFGYSRFF